MNLKSRLSQLQSQAGAEPRSPAAKPSLSTLRARIAQLEKHRPARSMEAGSTSALPVDALANRLDGKCIAEGLIRIRKRFPLSGELGSVALQSLDDKPCLPGVADNGQRNVYIDTETTGLSAGSGTLAFLIGIAFVESDAIELTQFLITGFSAEAALLSAFTETLAPDDRLVSYNGKSYDLPLLLTRFRMQRMAQPFDRLSHLDLLHPVRRLFARRWTDCRLISLEKNLLGFHRVDDLPGSEVPEAWFSYIRNGNGARLIKAVAHNQQDIVSLAVAHRVLAKAIGQPQTYGIDLYALGRWLSGINEDHARELLQSHAGYLCNDGKRLLGHLLRRAGDWTLAVRTWETLAKTGCTDSIECLAKYHEHISRDLPTAQHYCSMLPSGAAHEHRRRRVREKILARNTVFRCDCVTSTRGDADSNSTVN